MTNETSESKTAARVLAPPAPKPAPRELSGRDKWFALRDNITVLYFIFAAVAIVAGAVWIATQYTKWLADDQLVQNGTDVKVRVYAVNTYRNESKRSRDQSGVRYAHFVFPTPGEQRFRGTAMLRADQLPAEGVGGTIRILRFCPPGDVEVFAVESQYKALRDDSLAHRTAKANVKIDMRRSHHGRAHPVLKRALGGYTFTLPGSRVPLLRKGSTTAPAKVKFTGSYILSKQQEAAEKSGSRTKIVRVRYLRENPHVQLAEPVLQHLTGKLSSGAEVVDGIVKKIEPVHGLRPLLDLPDWRMVEFDFPTGRKFEAGDPALLRDPNLLGKPKTFVYGNVRLSGLEGSDPMEGDLLDVFYDPQNPTRFVLHQVHKKTGRIGGSSANTEAEQTDNVVLVHSSQKLTSAIFFPCALPLAGLAGAVFGMMRLAHVRRVAREGKAVLATMISAEITSVGLNSRRNFFRYEINGRRRQCSHTASVSLTGDLAGGDPVWVLVIPGQSRTAMIARAILPTDQFTDGESELVVEPALTERAAPRGGGRAAAIARAKSKEVRDQEEGVRSQRSGVSRNGKTPDPPPPAP